MNSTLAHVNLSSGRLGRADLPELCDTIINGIPLEKLLSAKTILDVACGYGGFAKAYVKRVEPYIGREEAMNRIWLIDSYRGCVNYCGQRLGFKHVIHADFLSWNPNMQFDIIIGNPPYNNAGKIKGAKQTSGTSLWVQFLKIVPNLLKEGGWCSLLVPSAVGNTNSLGWKALKNVRIEKINTKAGEWFQVGTLISCITFSKNPPVSVHLVDGVTVDRSKVSILPGSGGKVALSIFKKITRFEREVKWRRDYWPEFEKKSDGKEVVGMSFLDRSTTYKLQKLKELKSRDNLKKVNICWSECKNPEALIRFMGSKLISFYAKETMFSGQIQLGMIQAITYPKNWDELNTDEKIYEAYGLTRKEIQALHEI